MCETTVTGVLEWEDGNGSTIRFTSSANDPGANMTVGSVFYTLTDETPTSSLMSSAMVSSTNVDVLLLCTNGIETRNVRVNVAGQPGALNLSDPEPNNGPVLSSRVSWRGPDDIPNCCERYIAKIVSRTGKVEERVFSPTTTETNIFLNSSGTVTVFCQDAAGRNGTSSNSIQLPTGPRVTLDTSGVQCCGPSTVTATLIDDFFGNAVCAADVVSCNYGNRMVMAEQVDGSCTYRCTISEQIESTVTVLVTYTGIDMTFRNSTDICVQSRPCGPDIWFIIVIIVACVLGVLLIAVLVYAIIITILYCKPKVSEDTPKSEHISMGEKNFS